MRSRRTNRMRLPNTASDDDGTLAFTSLHSDFAGYIENNDFSAAAHFFARTFEPLFCSRLSFDVFYTQKNPNHLDSDQRVVYSQCNTE